jgi:hypothetical protein
MSGEICQDGVICPRCSALLVGVSACPDAGAHVTREVRGDHSASQLQLYGGQQPPYRSWYETDAKGRAILTFRKGDGAERGFAVLWKWRDPVTGVIYPWMIDQEVLDRDDLLAITGMKVHAFNAIAAHLPGRIPGRYTVACRTQEFIKEFLFGDLAQKQRWQRVTRSQKRRMHRPTCPPKCRKAHRQD